VKELSLPSTKSREKKMPKSTHSKKSKFPIPINVKSPTLLMKLEFLPASTILTLLHTKKPSTKKSLALSA
jgi:hypothetical protein